MREFALPTPRGVVFVAHASKTFLEVSVWEPGSPMRRRMVGRRSDDLIRVMAAIGGAG